MDLDPLTNFINQFETITKKPEKYLSLQDDESDRIKQFTKELYRYSKKKEFPFKKSEALDELVIKNLDEEQIWQQVELQNNSVLDNLVSNVAQLLAKKNKLKFPVREERSAKQVNGHGKACNFSKKGECENDDQFISGKEEKVVEKDKKKIVAKKPIKPSVVDDKFFKLQEMEEFLVMMEKTSNGTKAQSGSADDDNGGGDDDEGDDDSINYFVDDSESSDDNENQPKYSDFFDEPEDEFQVNKVKRQSSESRDETAPKKKVKFAIDKDDGNSSEIGSDEDDDDDDDDDDGNDGEDDDNDLFEPINDEEEEEEEDENEDKESEIEAQQEEDQSEPSTFEARQERLKKRINVLEESALSEKPWQMKGEISADKRPQNSLLQEYVEFDTATRPAPVLTEKSTLRLEDIILQRIKDKAWDDVVRKIKPIDNDIDYKKKLVLDQEKSKLSLAQIYEQEYLKQVENKALQDISDKPEVEPPGHQEIKGLLKNLFAKLDALSNFHFTPQTVSADIKIVSNLPAITMEEVAPVATSDATLLAPEEIKAKQKGDLIGKSERTATDKKRERRQKKLRQQIKFKKMEEKAKEKLENAKSNHVNRNKFSSKILQKITKSSNVTALDDSKGKYIRSSSAFFSKLQDESSGKIQRKNLELGKPKLTKKLKSKKHTK